MKQINQLQLIAIKFFVSKDYTIDQACKRCNVSRFSFYYSRENNTEIDKLRSEIIDINTTNKALRRTRIRKEAATDMVSEGLTMTFFDTPTDIDNTIFTNTIIPINWVGRGEGWHSTHGTERYEPNKSTIRHGELVGTEIVQIANYKFDRGYNQ